MKVIAELLEKAMQSTSMTLRLCLLVLVFVAAASVAGRLA